MCFDNWKKGKLHGPYKIYEPAKRKHLQIFVKGNFKNGKLHGLCEQYHNNGKLHFSTHYNKDKLEGQGQKYFYDQLKLNGVFVNTNRIIQLSMSHTDKIINEICDAVLRAALIS